MSLIIQFPQNIFLLAQYSLLSSYYRLRRLEVVIDGCFVMHAGMGHSCIKSFVARERLDDGDGAADVGELGSDNMLHCVGYRNVGLPSRHLLPVSNPLLSFRHSVAQPF